jgi:endonuclease/exonuclease/phosphatase family metal-dependent hydrolase
MSVPGNDPAAGSAELRVMTYNVRSLRDDVDALARVVHACAPDVLLVQEAPRWLRWRSKRAAMARRCGLVVATADRPGGLCILTALRVEVVATSFSVLAKSPGHHQRVLVGATVRRGGQLWRAMSVHMSTDPAEQARHLPALAAALSEDSDVPLVAGGDLNDDPGGAVFETFAADLQDCFAVNGGAGGSTSPARAPLRRLDAVFASRELTVVSCQAVDTPGVERASDHRPVLAVLSQSRR